MKVCVVGAGGREHALAVALSRTATVVVSPDLAGSAYLSGMGNQVLATSGSTASFSRTLSSQGSNRRSKMDAKWLRAR